jgi:GNAT superfamily N-acetyltransferase
MENENRQRMIKLADEFFEAKNDPDQISVTSDNVQRLKEIHPGTMTEETDERGPIAWILVIPTVRQLMDEFVSKRISERELLDRTPLHTRYDSLYLCSALVLPEYRRKGMAKRLLTRAIEAIQKDHPVKHLFYWAFSLEGEKLASSVSRELGLPLIKRGPG